MIISHNTSKALWMKNIKSNWDFMMLEESEIISLQEKKYLENNTTLINKININYNKVLLKYKRINKAEDGFKENTFTSKLSSLPTYYYCMTNLLQLWFVLRFNPTNKESITVNHHAKDCKTDLIIKYKGIDEVNVPHSKIRCFKYEHVNDLSFWMKMFYSNKEAFI